MKKLIALLLALVMVFALAACTGGNTNPTDPTQAPTQAPTNGNDPTDAPTDPTQAPTEGGEDNTEGVMTHAEYMAAAIDDAVVVEFYVQATQSWWNDQIVVYGQDKDGGYLAYNMACSQEDAAKLVPGTKIRVTGYKAEWKGLVEIDAGATFEFVEAEPWIAEPQDLTALLGTDELINHQNKLGAFKGLTVEAIEYKNGEPGDDIYLTLGLGGASYSFCVEVYLTNTSSDVYTTVGTLNVGDVVDVEGFVYWYDGVNPHITSIALAGETKPEGVMTHAEYIAAAIDDAVVVEFYVQATQSWWADQIVVYGQDRDGGYLAYNMACSQEDAAKLVPGTKIRVTGYKAEWKGLVEIDAGATFEFVEAEPWIAEPQDLTALLGTDELINHQNKLGAFKGLTVEAIEYKNGEPGDDIYVTLGYNGASYSFCVERYLTGPESVVYTTVGTLNVGDVVDVEGFVYWYDGVNPHITSIVMFEPECGC